MSSQPGSADSAGEWRASALRLLRWPDTKVIEDATTVLIHRHGIDGIALVCEALALADVENDAEAGETILWVLSPAGRSGLVDVPDLLREAAHSTNALVRQGAASAAAWLGLQT